MISSLLAAEGMRQLTSKYKCRKVRQQLLSNYERSCTRCQKTSIARQNPGPRPKASSHRSRSSYRLTTSPTISKPGSRSASHHKHSAIGHKPVSTYAITSVDTTHVALSVRGRSNSLHTRPHIHLLHRHRTPWHSSHLTS